MSIAKKFELMTFEIGTYRFGIDINFVQEINCHATVVRVPVDFAAVAGVINLRGEVLTVLDLGSMLCVQAETATTQTHSFIVIKTEQHRLAIAVDKLNDVETLAVSELKPLPANFKLCNQHVLKGIVQKDPGLLLVLDAAKVALLGTREASAA